MKAARALGLAFLSLGLFILLFETLLVICFDRIHLVTTSAGIWMVILAPALIVFPGTLHACGFSIMRPGEFHPVWEAAPFTHRLAWAIAAFTGFCAGMIFIAWFRGMLP
ncbi:MAG TPA: hypothetical protein VF267_07800 [Gammaproteobacteria bacterium]